MPSSIQRLNSATLSFGQGSSQGMLPSSRANDSKPGSPGASLFSGGANAARAQRRGSHAFPKARTHIDWSAENLESPTRTIVKKYNAEIHSQSAIEGILELKREYGFRAEDVGQIELETFDVAYNIIGGGEEGDRRMVRSKEEADHSLPYSEIHRQSPP